ncbi:MAG: protein phosphatase 2C domain-containing protein [Candidatus Kaiserbacteria bacterium]|nr:MAG: protein phosphatase 2C domain-containing protein [Candidatus Kaiserbacteria bacterium]
MTNSFEGKQNTGRDRIAPNERMHMHIEQLFDKGVGKINEDAMTIGATRFGVFDGVSSRAGYVDEHGKSGGYLAANIAKEVFETFKGSLTQTAMEANKRIESVMEDKGIDITKKENRWGTTMAVVDVNHSEKEFEWAQVADSLVIVIYTDGTFKQLIQDDYDHDRGIMSLWKELADTKTEDIRGKLDGNIRQLRQDVNVTFGVINGQADVSKFIRTGKESLENVAHILIFTDGLLIPKEDPQANDDFSVTVNLFLEGGLPKVRDHIRATEDTDPNCWKYPRYKKSDDIAAIAVSFQKS